MPTILVIFGWRLFFYANEGKEPIHVHCREHFDYIEEQWAEFQRSR